MLSRHRDSNYGLKQIFDEWRQGGDYTDKSDEEDKTEDSKSSRKEEGNQGEMRNCERSLKRTHQRRVVR